MKPTKQRRKYTKKIIFETEITAKLLNSEYIKNKNNQHSNLVHVEKKINKRKFQKKKVRNVKLIIKRSKEK